MTSTRAGGYQAVRTTTAVVIAARPFTKTGTPKISGTPRVGTTLTAAPGTWSPSPGWSPGTGTHAA